MRKACLLVAVFLTAALSLGDTPVEIKNAGFESIGPNGEAIGWVMPKRYWKAVPGAGSNGSGGLVFEGDDPKSRDWPHQWITVKEGKRYRLSANLRPDGLTCPRMGRWSGLSIYIEWFDATGKLTGCTMTYCVNGKSDWVRRETVTPVVKPGVAKCRIMPLVIEGGVGRAVIDDVSLIEIEERPVDGVWSSAYRDEASDGRVTFAAGLHLPEGVATNDLRAIFTYYGADGTRRAHRGVLSADAARLETDVSKLAFGTNEVACTLYKGTTALGSDRMSFARVRALTPRRVRFDAQQRLLVDGKPFLPIGVYCLEIDRPNLDILADSPFNCLMSYRFPTSDAELDLCQEKGMKVLYDVRCKTDTIHDDEIGRSWIRQRIPEVRKHPAVLAWYSDDESPMTLVPRLRGRYRLLRELDPDHPVWAVQDKTDMQLRDYLGTFDVVGTDPYPVSRHPIGNVIRAVRAERDAMFGLKPIWQVPQAFAWNESDRKGERAPTSEEIANMTWQSIAGGANGFVYFRYHQLRERESKGGAKWWKDIWPGVCAAARDVKRFEQVILGEPGQPVPDAPADIAVRSWKVDGADWFLFVNATTNRLSCDVALANVSGAWKTEFGLAGSVRPVARGLSLDLCPLAVTLAVRR